MIKKGIGIILYLGVISVILFFVISLFLKFFFNDFLIEAPSLVGRDISEITQTLQNYDLKLKVIGEDFSDYDLGIVYSQIPAPGKKVKKGKILKIWISKGKNETTIPKLIGEDLVNAKVLLDQAGLKLKRITYTHHKLGYNKVIASTIDAGSIVKRGTEISLLVSLRKDTKFVYMPDIIGLDYKKAEDILYENNLSLGSIDYIKDSHLARGVILDTEPRPGEKVVQGTVVNLIINRK